MIAIVVGAVLLLAGCCCAFAMFLGPWDGVPSETMSAAQEELASRVATDFPDWEVVSYDIETFTSTEGAGTDCTYFLKPPDRQMVVGIQYSQRGSEPLRLHDEVLHSGARYSERADALLDCIDQHYTRVGLVVSAVYSDGGGKVYVDWDQPESDEGFSFGYFGTDILRYDPESGTWDKE